MKKILSVILGLALCCMLAALPVCAEETAAPVQAETAEIGDGYVTLVSDSNQLIPVYVDEEAEGAVGTVEQAMSDFSVGGTIMGLINDSGIYDIIKGNWKSAVMILISFVLLYLAIVKQFEPLLCLHFQTVFHHQKSIPVLFQGSTCTTFLRGFPARYRFFMLHSHRLLVLQRK